jgi:hypothetical protein
MFCKNCHTLMIVDHFGFVCSQCRVFVFRTGAPISEPPPALTSTAVASAAVSAVYPKWPSVHSELSFVTNPRRAFLLIKSNFPCHIWEANLDCRALYADAVLRLCRGSELDDSSVIGSHVFDRAEHLSLVQLKRLVYGMDRAREPFSPLKEGEKLREFTESAMLVRKFWRSFLNRLPSASFCQCCGMVGLAELLNVSREPGCADCRGHPEAFQLTKQELRMEDRALTTRASALRVKSNSGVPHRRE